MNLDTHTTLARLAFGEMEGKNKAIHAYDQMIWTIRSGFVTLFFAGWGLLFKEVLGIERFSWLHAGVFAALVLTSGMLACAATSIERNYARRKFRVIASLNALMSHLEQETLGLECLAGDLRVAGDSDAGDPDTPGFRAERAVGRLIYGMSVVAVLLGLVLVLVGALLDGRVGKPEHQARASVAFAGVRPPHSEARP